MSTFSINKYPKSYASIKENDYRLNEYLDKSNEELYILFKELEELCVDIAKNKTPISIFKNLPYIASGWEWSVFKLNDAHVLKIPAEIFPEVSTQKYLDNSKETYELTLRYYCEEFIARTFFSKEGDRNIIQQEYVYGDNDFLIPFNTSDTILLQNLKLFLTKSEKIIKELDWIPDIDVRKTDKGFLLRNIIIDSKTRLPKIIDTTYYLDPYRMYPQLKKDALRGMINRILQFSDWLKDNS